MTKGTGGMAKRKRSGLTSATAVLKKRYYDGKPEERISRATATMADLALGDKIRTMREEAGLTQAELAARIGTQPSQISRIEDADYDGHSVETLRRIAKALRVRLRIEFLPENADSDPGLLSA